VADQINNERFIIEHSRDGWEFAPIGAIEVGINQLEAQTYTFDHRLPPVGTHYYRIKQMDFDGRFSYSNIAQVEIASQALVFHPNPAKDYISLEQSANQLAIYNLQGRLVLNHDLVGNQLIPIGQLPVGMYLIKVDGQALSQKLIVK